MIKNDSIINCSGELIPNYKISPFTNSDIRINKNLPISNEIDGYFENRFGHDNFVYTISGRQAIGLALSHYNLKSNDHVTIYTTSGNFYISSCVTKEIEKFCKWSRKIESSTKVIFINHEFGYPYENLNELRDLNLPIIEDCAFSFYTKGSTNAIGNLGDFAIYSFPKMFPIQIGGLLKQNIKTNIKEELDNEAKGYIKKVLSYYISSETEIINKRIKNYNYLTDILKEIDIYPRFHCSSEYIPGVYMFRSNNKINYPELKLYMTNNGIQCSVFYGEDSFFIPLHQNLSFGDLKYFKEVINSFLNTHNG